MEARVGIEPTHKAFAEPCLTTWLPRHESEQKIEQNAAGASLFNRRLSEYDVARFSKGEKPGVVSWTSLSGCTEA